MRSSSVSWSHAGCLFLAPVVLFGAAAACGGDAKECRLGADCASGQCSADGLCVVNGDTDGASSGQATSSSGNTNASSSGGGGSSGGSSGGQTSSSSSSSGSSGTPGACIPNNDGTITQQESPLLAGITAKYKFATNVTVDLDGALVDGVRRWELTGPFDGDHDVSTTTRAVAGSWFASDYPTGQVAGLLDTTRDATACSITVSVPSTLAVLRADDNFLNLLGVVSNSDTEPTSSKTNLAYDKPIPTLKFPLTMGSEWGVEDAAGTGTLNGTSIGFPGNTVTDTYASKVVDRGVVATPFAVFDVLKVVTTLTRSSTNFCLISTTKTVSFVSECAGTVAKVISQPDEDSDNFTDAAEVQRITP